MDIFFYIWSFACFATAGKNKLTYDAKLKPGYLSVGGAIQQYQRAAMTCV